jgi:serine/threonine protein kinase/tetratricopeptide (TPR) repeat protein
MKRPDERPETSDLPEALRARSTASGAISRPEQGHEQLLDASVLRKLARAPSVPLGLPDAIGAYRVLERLGRGGMGVVYRAEHRDSGATVALKCVEAPDRGLLQGIRREIGALARLRHPGIVRILEHGVQDGLPWYAMELLEGRTLRELAGRSGPDTLDARTQALTSETDAADAWWTRSLASFGVSCPQPTRTAVLASDAEEGAAPSTGPVSSRPEELRLRLSIVRRLCGALAYLHGEGLVHRDLKPENVLVRPDGMPVLVDFGLATQTPGKLGREVLDVEGGISGTAAYMAPEQACGELVDARADLYALGCILFELVTGRRPFLGAGVMSVLYGHLREPPPVPSGLVQDVPPALDELILRLLEKQPRERLGHADAAAAVLGRLGASDGACGPRPRPYVYRPGFVGREAQLELLSAALRRLESGEGALLLLGGESGAGKTRLALELGRMASARGLLVLTGENVERGARPLQALRGPLQALADRCRERGAEEAGRIFGARAPLLALHVPAVLGLPGQAAQAAPAELPPDQARERMLQCLAQTLEAVAAQGPLLLILDDLQWADELSLGLLEQWLREDRLSQSPLLLVGTYRSEEVEARGSGPLAALLQSPGAQRLQLGRLEPEAVAEMVAEMLALHPAPAILSRHLSRHSEGNPFFVAEYLRAAVEEGLLYRDAAGRWQVKELGLTDEARAAAAQGEAGALEAVYESLPLPLSVRALVERRLEGLPARTLQLVEAAAVMGRETPARALQAMTGLEEEDLFEAVAEAERRQIFEEPDTRLSRHPSQEASFPSALLRFEHDKIREAAYGMLSGEQRTSLHRAAAEALEALPAVERDEQQAALGHHWERAGEPDRAIPYYREAARIAKKRHALDEAEQLYRGCLRLTREPNPESVAVRNELASGLLQARGHMGAAEAEHRRALAEAVRIRDPAGQAEALRGLGSVLRLTGRAAEARQSYEQALALARDLGDRAGEGITLNGLAILHHDQGRLERAARLWERGLRRVREARDHQAEIAILSNLASLQETRGRYCESQELYQRALALLRARGEKRSEGIVLGNLAVLHSNLGRSTDARALLEEALAIAREVEDRRNEAILLSNLARLVRESGEETESRVLAEQALALARRIRDPRTEALMLAHLARLDLDQGRLEAARVMLEQGASILHEIGERAFEAQLLGELANLGRLEGSDLAGAEALMTRAEGIAAQVGVRLDHAKLACSHGHLALARGQDGRPLLEQAGAIAAELGVRAESELGRAVERLARALEAYESGEQQRLLRGELVEDIPAALRRRLEPSGDG